MPSNVSAADEHPAVVKEAQKRLDNLTEKTLATLAPLAPDSQTERPWDHDAVVPTDETIGGLIRSFLEAHPKADKNRLNRYRDWVDVTAGVDLLNGSHCREYFNHLLEETAKSNGAISRKYAKDCLATFKQFVRYLVRDVELLEVEPKNLRELTIAAPTQAVQVIDPATIRRYLRGGAPKDKKLLESQAKADDRMRLFLLLMMNCGMYQADISALAPDEVDWQRGRIIRRRTKTADNDGNVPVSNYVLWPETLALLKRHRTDGEERVLLSEAGTPLVTTSVGGKSRNDAVRLAFKRFRKRLGLEAELPLKHIRKTSASMIAKEYSEETATLFLGDSPTTVAGRHYLAIEDTRLDDCLEFLRREYRVADVLDSGGTVK